MDTGLMHKGLISLPPGGVLRLRNVAGRYIGVVRGTAWVTQDGDPRDFVLGAGESLRFDRDGRALVMPLGVEARLVLEDGLVAEGKEAARGLFAHEQDFAQFERRARQLRAEAVAEVFASMARSFKEFLGRIVRNLSAAIQSRRTAGDLRGLSDHMLRDVGLQRHQIDCIARGTPC